MRYVRRRSRLRTTDLVARAGRIVIRKQGWVDPFPGVHGTVPEKIVYAELSKRGIPFLFLNDFHAHIPDIQIDKYYQADFMIPSLKIIIEVNGAHWHAMPKTIEADAFKYALYEMSGWRILAWWDYQILKNVAALFAAEPLLNKPIRPGAPSSELPVVRRTKVDSSKGIRTLNRKNALRKQWKKPAPRLRKRKSDVV